MTCETCGATLEEVERMVFTPEEAKVYSDQQREIARAYLRGGAGSPTERQVWQLVADTGIDVEGEWVRLDCPSGCGTVFDRAV